MTRSLCLASLVALLVPGLATAQDTDVADPAAWVGVWRARETSSQRERRHAAIDAATADMSVLWRGRARSGLRDGTTPPREMRLHLYEGLLTLEGVGDAVTLRLDGETRVRRRDKTIRASARRSGTALVVRFVGESGSQTMTYAPSADGRRLSVTVVMRGERLDAPIRYRVTYVRR